MTHEPEFDTEQYEMLTALAEYEAGLGSHGLPLEETTSPLADPDNPQGEWFYAPRVLRDWFLDAVETEARDSKWSGENYSRARLITAYRVDR